MFYVRDNIKCQQIQWTVPTSLECLGLSITLSPQMQIIVIGLYRPPTSINVFYDELHSVLKQYNFKKEVILLGDFNINWNVKSIRRQLKTLTESFDLVQLIKKPTRITNFSESCIDLVYKSERIQRTYSLVTGLSDHNMILFSRKLSKTRTTSAIHNRPETNRIPKGELPNLENALNQIIWSNYIDNKNAEES